MNHRFLSLIALGLVACAAGDGAGRFGNTTCRVTVGPHDGPVPTLLTARSEVNDPDIGRWARTWRVNRGGKAVAFKKLDGDAARIEVDGDTAGTYHFEVEFDAVVGSGFCRASDVATITAPNAKTALYRLRVTPPAASALPRQDKLIEVIAGASLERREVMLSSGSAVTATLTGPKGPIAGTVRFLDDGAPANEPAPRLDVVAAAAGDGKFSATLPFDRAFRTVLVPADPQLAPMFGPAGLGASFKSASYTVEAGGAVTGAVRDEGGMPVAGARVTLRAGGLTSTVGVTSGQGAFALRAAPGSYAVHVQATGMPSVASSAIMVKDGTTVDITYAIARITVAGKVVGTGGGPVAGARVRLRSAPIARVARVKVGGAAMDADGAIDLAVTTAPDGSLPALALPAGTLEALIEPPGSVSEGVTAKEVKVAQGERWTIALEAKRSLGGVVRDQSGSPVRGARVLVIARGGPGAALEDTTDVAGGWSVPVDPGLAVDVLVDPPVGSALVRAHAPIDRGGDAPDVVLGPGAGYSGLVRPPSGAPLAGARIEAWCTAACRDTFPSAVTATDADGSFALVLPDPK